jgi:MYXO-CTERM domain-containing protein
VSAGMIGLDPVAWRSTDGGETFVPLPAPPHIRALAARSGLLYASADNFMDDFAIGVSLDEGMTWQPLMSYTDVRAMNDCVHAACRGTCLMLADMGLWAPAICDATGPTDGAAGGGDGPPRALDAATTDGGHASKTKAGCSCAAAPNRDGHPWGFVMILAVVLAGTRRRAPRR